jgi:hypothetical protein
MTDSPATLLAADGPKTRPRGGRILAPTRYRHPGDVIRLIAAALVLAVAAATAALLPALLRPGAAAITGVRPATAAGRVLTGLVQVMIAAAAVVLLVAALRHRRFPGGCVTIALRPATQQAAVDQSLAAQVPVIVGYVSRAALGDELAQRSGGRLRLN